MQHVFHHFPVTRNVKIHCPIHLGTFVYDAKAVTSRRSRECRIISSGCEVLSTSGRNRLDFYNRSLKITSDQ